MHTINIIMNGCEKLLQLLLATNIKRCGTELSVKIGFFLRVTTKILFGILRFILKAINVVFYLPAIFNLNAISKMENYPM